MVSTYIIAAVAYYLLEVSVLCRQQYSTALPYRRLHLETIQLDGHPHLIIRQLT